MLSGSSALDALVARRAHPPADKVQGLQGDNAGFGHRTGYEGLSRDAAEVDADVADRLAGGGALVELLGQRDRDAGLGDVTVRRFPGGRHEPLNETNRDQVTADIIAWLRPRGVLASAVQ